MKIETFEGKDGWRWRIKGDNNEILATSEAYYSKSDAERTVKLIRAGINDDDTSPPMQDPE
jgi:uncharacterized protein YegP (UPF0339 family)